MSAAAAQILDQLSQLRAELAQVQENQYALYQNQVALAEQLTRIETAVVRPSSGYVSAGYTLAKK